MTKVWFITGSSRGPCKPALGELEKWLPVSLSTDHDDAENFLETELGKSFTSAEKNGAQYQQTEVNLRK